MRPMVQKLGKGALPSFVGITEGLSQMRYTILILTLPDFLVIL